MKQTPGTCGSAQQSGFQFGDHCLFQARGQGLTSKACPESCDLGCASCTPPAVPLGTSSLRSTAGAIGRCPAAWCRARVRASVLAHRPWLVPHSPARLSQKQCVDGRGRAPVPVASRVWSHPQASVFLPHHSVDPPHYFCSCSVAVSTLPLGPFLCFLKGTWSLLSPCGTPHPPPPLSRTVSGSSGQRVVTVSTTPSSVSPWLPSALWMVTLAQ